VDNQNVITEASEFPDAFFIFMDMRGNCLVWILLLIYNVGDAQNQLVLIKNDEVQVRYLKGDDLTYKRKNGKKLSGFIVEINDTTIITSNDTVAIHQIERMYFKKGNLMNLMGGFLVVAGAGIFVIDQINTIIVNGEEPSLDDNVTQISLTALAIGLPMMLLKRNSHRIGFKQRLRIVDKDSPFYFAVSRFEPTGLNSPHIPRN
jgi:hypothetical protein